MSGLCAIRTHSNNRFRKFNQYTDGQVTILTLSFSHQRCYRTLSGAALTVRLGRLIRYPHSRFHFLRRQSIPFQVRTPCSGRETLCEYFLERTCILELWTLPADHVGPCAWFQPACRSLESRMSWTHVLMRDRSSMYHQF